MAESVRCPAFDLGSGLDLRVMSSSPGGRLHARQGDHLKKKGGGGFHIKTQSSQVVLKIRTWEHGAYSLL